MEEIKFTKKEISLMKDNGFIISENKNDLAKDSLKYSLNEKIVAQHEIRQDIIIEKYRNEYCLYFRKDFPAFSSQNGCRIQFFDFNTLIKRCNDFIQKSKDLENRTEKINLDEAINHIQSAYVGDSKGMPCLLLGDVAELIKILTGKEVDINVLEKYK